MEKCCKEADLVFDSKLFKALSEPVRCQILNFLAASGPVDISTVAAAFPQDRSVISRHLQTMHRAGLLNVKKQAKWIIYEINGPQLLGKIEAIVKTLREIAAKLNPDIRS